MLGFLIRAGIVALGLWLATAWVNGVSIDTPATLILAGILLGIVNSIVRPIAILLTLPMWVPATTMGYQPHRAVVELHARCLERARSTGTSG